MYVIGTVMCLTTMAIYARICMSTMSAMLRVSTGAAVAMLSTMQMLINSYVGRLKRTGIIDIIKIKYIIMFLLDYTHMILIYNNNI